MIAGFARTPALAALLAGATLLIQSSTLHAQSDAGSRSWTSLAASTWLTRARRHAAQGDTLAAIHDYTEAIRIDPSLGAALLELATIRSALGDQRETEWLLNRAASIPDVRAEALSRRAQFHLGMGQRALALADLQAAVEAGPSRERLRALADFFVQQKAWVAALAVWRRMANTPSLGEAERAEAAEMIAALAALAAEADGVQHDMFEHSWVRRALRRHATPRLQRAR